MAFQAIAWWEDPSVQSTVGKPALHWAAWLCWCFTSRLLMWGGSSRPLQMPLLLRLQLDYPTSWWREETRTYQVGCSTAPRCCILPFSLPSPPAPPTSPPQLLHSLSGLWETWQVPSLLSQTCSTPCTPHHQPLLTHQYPKATAQKQL